MHITITGNLGSGKSTVARLLGERYHFEIYSTGKVQRELAREMNMTTLELNELMRSNQKYDRMIDDAVTRISRENKDKDIIFDSRLAWNFVEQSFKVFVSVSLDTAATRVMNDNRGEEEKYVSLEEAKNLLAARAATERVRYKEIYNLNYMDFSNYNLVIDSTYCTQETIAEVILREAKEYEKNPTACTKQLLSPKRLLFGKESEEEDKKRLNALIQEYMNMPIVNDIKVKVKKQEEDYLVIEGLDNVKAAYYAEVCFLPIEVIKD
ncbi:MAG TPA: cytidylate kinase family protein [Mobilitalea sp.]|nr:cytidylate kinase family protein [Mobilitalea sp.]